MATEYTLEIPARTRSFAGAVLDSAYISRFSTAEPKLEKSTPEDGAIEVELLAPVVLKFNQRVDESELLPRLKLLGGKRNLILRTAPANVREHLLAGWEYSEALKSGSVLVAVPEAPLDPDTQYSIEIAKGTRLAEGPTGTTERIAVSFHTLSSLKLERVSPEDREATSGVEGPKEWEIARPGRPIRFDFNHALDASRFREDWVSISPKPEAGMARVTLAGSGLLVTGILKAGVTYRFQLSSDIIDIYGQRLGKASTPAATVQPSLPQLITPESNTILLAHDAEPIFPVVAMNQKKVEVEVRAVDPWEYRQFLKSARSAFDSNAASDLNSLGKIVFTQEISTPQNEAFELAKIPLAPAFTEGFGTACVILRIKGDSRGESKVADSLQAFWIHKPKILLEYLSEGGRQLVHATSASDGAPAAGVELVIRPSGKTLKTDARGLARVDGLLISESKTHGTDSSELPWIEGRLGYAKDALFMDSLGWHLRRKMQPLSSLRLWGETDRPLYRPGEEVRVHGWVRSLRDKGEAKPELASLSEASWVAKDPRGVEVGRGSFPISAESGQYDFSFKLPSGVNLGRARVSLKLSDLERELGFSVQEFRKPEFEGSVLSDQKQYRLGDEAVFTLSTQLFGGGNPSGLPVRWKIDFTRAHYSSAHWPEFNFYGEQARLGSPWRHEESAASETGADGKAGYRVKFNESASSSPLDVIVTATVQDLNRQARSFNSNARLYTRDRAIGLKPISSSIRMGRVPEFEMIVLDPSAADGKLFSGAPVELELWSVPYRWGLDSSRSASGQKNGELIESIEVSSAEQPSSVRFTKKLKGGQYEVRARALDSQGRKIESRSAFMVFGGGSLATESQERPPLKLKWDGLNEGGWAYAGKTLRLSILSFIEKGRGFAVLSSHGRFETREFEIQGGVAKLSIEPEARDETELRVEVEVISENGSGIDRASISANIARPERHLEIALTPSTPLPLPGSSISIEAVVRDGDSHPVPKADVWVFAVDDALLSIEGHSLENPSLELWKVHSREWTSIRRREDFLKFDPHELLRRLEDLNQPAPEGLFGGRMREFSKSLTVPAPMMVGAMDDDGAGEGAPVFSVRKDFRSLAFYEGKLKTDAQGRVSFKTKLPDSVTRYTVFAVAVDHSGRGASRTFPLQTGLPFSIRPSFPRFLSVGDHAELSVLVQNQTDEAREAQVVARAWGIEMGAERGFKVKVPSHEAREVRFPVQVKRAGRALVQVGLRDPSSKQTDAVQQSLPVYLPATIEAYAQSGSFESKAVSLPVESPNGVEPGIGGLEVRLSSSRIQSLEEVWNNLMDYPFDCSEQVASKLLAFAALKPLLGDFLPIAAISEWEARIPDQLGVLSRRMRPDGSFNFWGTAESGEPYITVHVAHALVRAKRAGVKVPESLTKPVLKRISTIRSWVKDLKGTEELADRLEAYSLRVRALSGESVGGEAARLWSAARGRTTDPSEMDSELLGHLLPLVPEVKTLLLNRVDETDGRAHLVSAVQQSGRTLLQSDRRAEAVVLEALLETEPKNELIPKLLEGVLGVKSQGLWSASTQENAFVLLAVGKYLRVLERAVPNFIVRVWLDQGLKAERRFSGREPTVGLAGVPIDDLGAERTRKLLVLQKEGKGRVYYRIGMKFAPKGMDFLAEDRGFEVSRAYEAVDDARDVRQDENGIWRIKAGARVRIRTRVFTQGQREQVALSESFAGGFEPEAIEDSWRLEEPCFGWGNWFQHSQLRDQRAEAFASSMNAGEYELVTLVRATGLGRFVAPPTRIEEMYSPDVFGRSRSDQVWIQE
jgi:uncharacterized protein YfaS (alpha-2-macroglobulin family)